MGEGERRNLLTDAYLVGVDLRERIRGGEFLSEALHAVDGPFRMLEDGYPDWHPAPYDFEGMLTLFLYREITGQSYRDLAQYPELADVFGLARIPDEAVLSRAWRQRFGEGEREFVTTAAHYVVKEIHDRDMSVPAARPKQEVVTPERDPSGFDGDTDPGETTGQSSASFDQESIVRTTRLAQATLVRGLRFWAGTERHLRGHPVLRATDVHGHGRVWNRPGGCSVPASPRSGVRSPRRYSPPGSQAVRV
jgi:hypothetical protein